MGIVHIELDGMEQVGLLTGWCIAAVNEILAPTAKEDLASDGHLGALLVPDGTCCFILVVENDGDTGLVDAGLALFVD